MTAPAPQSADVLLLDGIAPPLEIAPSSPAIAVAILGRTIVHEGTLAGVPVIGVSLAGQPQLHPIRQELMEAKRAEAILTMILAAALATRIHWVRLSLAAVDFTPEQERELARLVERLHAHGLKVTLLVGAEQTAHLMAGADHVSVHATLDPRFGPLPRGATIASATELVVLVADDADLEGLAELLTLYPLAEGGEVLVRARAAQFQHEHGFYVRVAGAVERHGWRLCPVIAKPAGAL